MSDLPVTCQTIRLASPVLELFERELEFKLADRGNAGLMYGHFSSPDQLTIDYVAPFFRDVASGVNFGRGYAIGRCETLTAMARHLLAFQPVGYWCSYLYAPDLERAHADLLYYRRPEIQTQNYARPIASREGTGPVMFQAYTMPEPTGPPEAWQPLMCLQ